MKHIRTYETIINRQITDPPDVGDYVICNDMSISSNKPLKDFLDNNIGKITIIRNEKDYPYYIHYDNVPDEFSVNFIQISDNKNVRDMSRNEITYWSKNKKELETIILRNKFNL